MKKFLAIAASALVLALGLIGFTPQAKAVTPVYEGTYDFTTLDNGMQGLWATDYFHSNVTIYEVGEGTYEVHRDDGGTFTVLDGAGSPGGSEGSLVGNGTQGTIDGGVVVTILGSLKPELPSSLGPDDLRESQEDYFNKYFGVFFDNIERGDFVSWGWTYSTCNNGTWVDNGETESIYEEEGPNDLMGDITGDYVPCATPTTDVCANIDGDQASVPGGLHLDASGRNCVDYQFGGPPPPPPAVLGGQVLGASTLGATGGAEENIFLALFALGSILVGTGVRKLGVPRE